MSNHGNCKTMRTLSADRHLGLGFINLICCALMSMPVVAQTTMRPGLWEVTSKVAGSGEMGAKMAAAQAQMQKQIAAMPPEQRKQMEKMLAEHGMSLSPGAGDGMTVRMCVTKEMAERKDVPMHHAGDCRTDYVRSTGNTTRFAYTCSKPPSNGEGEIVLLNPESYTMKMNIASQVQGKSQPMTVEAQGKWLATECGSLKPPQR